MTTAPSRSWKFPTSPRSPYKIKPELRLLSTLQREVWNKETQLKFAQLLADSSDYRGEVSEKETDFAARDRLRGPSILGFIKKPDREESRLVLTEVGNYFIDCDVFEEELIFQRQIAKVQFGSPANRKNVEKYMNIRPLGFMIKTLKEVTELTKEEMALYCITTTDFREAKSSIETIIRNRNEIKEEKSAEKRKYLREEQRNKRLLEVYKQDIASGNTSLREGGEGFILTKYRTLRDFADSSFRYFLATGLFSINYQRQTFQLVKGRMQESNFLLDEYGMEIDNDPTSDYAEYIDSYLGNAQEVEIWRDSRIHQDDDAKKLIHFISVHNPVLSEKFKIQYSHASDRVAKLTALNAMEHSSMNIHRVVESRELRENMAMSYPEIKKVYKEISTLRNSMLDKPLMFEWNTWRLFNLFQNSVSVVGNFLSDADGNPLRTASGGLADIVCEFEDFWLIVEVTLQTGMKQYETEGEPITRHVGNHLRMLRENGDERPVFGLFIAEKVNPELVFYLNSIAWRSSQYYGGKIRIFPLEIERLLNAFDLANLKELNSSILHDWFHEIFGDAFEKTGELDWNLNGIELLKNFISERGK